MIEISSALPDVILAKPLAETFMRDAFRFEYKDPYQANEKCRHKCYGSGCKHPCCNRGDEIEYVDVTVTSRDGNRTLHSLKSLDYCSPASEAKNNAIDKFWGTETYLERAIPARAVRLSNTDLDEDFEWDKVSYEDDNEEDDYNFTM